MNESRQRFEQNLRQTLAANHARKMSSADGASEPQPQQARSTLATGSGPVSPEKFLAILIGDTKYRIETYRREQDACRDAKLYAQSSWAEGYADAEEKTLLMLQTLYDRLGFSTER
jgi:hypothetical protein